MTTYAEQVAPGGVIDAAREVLGGLDDTLWAAKRPEELLATKRQLERLRSQIAALDYGLASEIEATGAAASDGWASPGDYLTAVSAGRNGSGQAVLRTGRDLVGDRGLTWGALRSGDVSPEQAKVIVAAIGRLPVKQALRTEAELVLLEQARTLNASDLEVAGRHLLEVLDPEGTDRRDEAALRRSERSAHLNRHLTITGDGMGGVKVRGRGTVEDAAIIKAALWPLPKPLPVSAAECDEDGKDPRDHTARLWDALVEGCQRLLDTEVLPEAHGAKPRLSLTMDYHELRAGLGVGMLDTGEELSASAIRKLCCDADITALVLGPESEILDVGRTQRLVTAAIWKGLVIRDRHCAFPGCRRPPIACDAHHIQHWLDGGGTSLDNMVLLCRAHHTTVHQTEWTARLNPRDRRPEFLPPRTLDPERQPIRERYPRE